MYETKKWVLILLSKKFNLSDEEECRNVPQEKCHEVSIPVCKNIPKHECHKIEVPKCYNHPEKICERKAKKECHTVYKPHYRS